MVYSCHRFTGQHCLYRHSSTLKTLQNAATKLCDVTSQTTQFKVSAMRPTNINFRRFVLAKWQNLTSRRRAQPDSYFVFWRSRVHVSTPRPVTLSRPKSPPLSPVPAVKFPDCTSHANKLYTNHPTIPSTSRRLSSFPKGPIRFSSAPGLEVTGSLLSCGKAIETLTWPTSSSVDVKYQWSNTSIPIHILITRREVG